MPRGFPSVFSGIRYCSAPAPRCSRSNFEKNLYISKKYFIFAPEIDRRMMTTAETKTTEITQTAGYKEAMDDVAKGRVTEYASLKDFYKEMGL